MNFETVPKLDHFERTCTQPGCRSFLVIVVRCNNFMNPIDNLSLLE